MTPIRKAVFPVGGLGTPFPAGHQGHPEGDAAGGRQAADAVRRRRGLRCRHPRDDLRHSAATSAPSKTISTPRTNSRPSSKPPARARCSIWCIPSSPTTWTSSMCASRVHLGLGHAVLCAERLVGDQPFAVLLADDLMMGRDQLQGGSTVLGQMVDAFARSPGTVLAVQDVPRADTRRYGCGRRPWRILPARGGVRHGGEAAPEPGTLHPCGGRALHPHPGGVREHPPSAPRRGWRDPAHRRHCRPDRHRKGPGLPL